MILVPPKTEPDLFRGNSRPLPQADLAGPFLENVTEYFFCYVSNVLPGKNSTSFKFYFDGKLRHQSKDGVGEVVEKDEGDGTKSVEWKLNTFLSRSDNGGNFRCEVDWKAGQYEIMGLSSKQTEQVNVTCECPALYNRTTFNNKKLFL